MALDVLGDLVAKLPELKEEHERLGRLIQAIEAYAGAAPGTATVPGNNHPVHRGGPGIRPDQFFGQSTAEATKQLLAHMRKPMGPRAIAEALVAGGQGVDVDTVYANVASALKRMKKAEEVVQVKRNHWGLPNWYGARFRRKNSSPQPKVEGQESGDNGGNVEAEAEEDVDLSELLERDETEAGD